MSLPPLAIDLCCGLGGWTVGLLAEGWRVVGIDIVRPRSFPSGAQFVQQDVSTCSGLSFRGRVDLIVASPPCTEFSVCSNFSKHRRPDPEAGMVLVRHCFRIARESQAPFIIENVAGARRWFAPEFGPPTWHVGPYYFWGHALVLRPMGLFQKGGWKRKRNTLKKTGSRASGPSVRDPAKRAFIPLEIARAVGSQFHP